jgi:VWFA-related protein
MKKLAILVLALLLAGVFLSVRRTFAQSGNPQEPSTQQPAKAPDDEVVRITTNLIQLDVTVTDKNGKPVEDLRPEDFEILENNRSRTISNFSYVSAGKDVTQAGGGNQKPTVQEATPQPPTRLTPDQVKRTTALVVDDIELSAESLVLVRQALKKFIDNTMKPGDLIAIIRTSNGFGTLQQFTSDKRLLYAAIDSLKLNVSGRGVSTFPPMEGRIVVPQKFRLDPLKSRAEAEAIRQDQGTWGVFGALGSIVKGIRPLPGRKSVVVLSEGFRLFNSRGERIEKTQELMQRLIDQANRASVVIYTVDARGLAYAGPNAEDVANGMDATQITQNLDARRRAAADSQYNLGNLADQTGGFAIKNTNDLGAGLKEIAESQEGYYLIGYRPDEETFDPAGLRFNSFKIKVNRPGVVVRYRGGFVGDAEGRANPGRAVEPAAVLAQAVTSPFDAAGVGLKLNPLFGNSADGGSFVRLLIHIDTKDLTFSEPQDGWRNATFDLTLVAFDDAGRPRSQVARTHTMQVRTEAFQQALDDGITYDAAIPLLAEGVYQVRVAVRDTASNRTGAVGRVIEIPKVENKKLTLSGISTVGLDSAILNLVAAAPENAEHDPMADAALRRFRPGMIMRYGCIIYNAQSKSNNGGPQLQTRTRLLRDGAVVFDSGPLPFVAEATADPRRLSFSSAIRLGRALPEGNYVLQVVVTDALAKEKDRVATQWVDFEIVKTPQANH